MYIPVDQEVQQRLLGPDGNISTEHVVCVASNREKSLMAITTPSTLYIWLAHPHLLLTTICLSEEDTADKGTLVQVHWRYDSSSIAITTSRNHILIYRVDVSDDNCYNLIDPADSYFRRTSHELFLRGKRHSVALRPAVIANLAAPATCCVALREELFVCCRNGYAHHISWDGVVHSDYSIRLTAVPFANDQLQSKPEFINDGAVHIVDAVYAPLIGGYCIVLSDGRAALLTSSDSRFHPNSLLGVWALQMKDASCTDVNHKFRLLAFGCKNGDIAAYHLDDANGALVQTFRVALRIRNGPELLNRVGPVTKVQVLTNGGAMAAVWSNRLIDNQKENGTSNGEERTLPPTLAIFTPFGAQTWCSLESISESAKSSNCYTWVDWGPEGYHLWLGRSDGLGILPMARSAALGNPVMEHTSRVVLLSGSQVLLSPPRERETRASAPQTVWTSLHAPHDYLAANWPIRFASMDRDSKTLVVAGARGLAHCTLSTGRWKIFGNESQERDIIVTGGVFVWNGTAAAACYDADSGREQIRFYPLNSKLDNRFASSVDTEARVLIMSLRNDALVTFDTEARILLYKMRMTDDGLRKDSYVKVAMDRVAEIRVGDLITHPACLASIQLTQLNHDAACASFIPGVDTVLVNVSGRLITLNPKSISKDDDEDVKFQLNQPIMVASFVEQLWHDRACGGDNENETSSHLTNALWINCGAKGMRVWLPLFPGRRGPNTQEPSFIAKRIMLPFELDIYPAVICANDCLAIGVESLPSLYTNGDRKPMALYSLHRNSEVFVHHLLRQLLKRNLGVFALEVAASCRRLPHFPHSLELLLHGVLEEEATSSEPIPDPLLPRCVAFIQEFPEFLRTVAHCARKTELALWSSLFAVTGSPNDLFEVCLRDGLLQTAASYLIVLQNIENMQTSQEQASRLLREALSAGSWGIAKDMVRFARAIDADDMDSPTRTPPPQQKTSSSTRRPTTSINGSEANDLVFARFQAAARVNRVRHSHTERDRETSRKDSTGSSTKKVTRGLSNDMSPPSPSAIPNPMAEKMEEILNEHAARLLEECCIRDLGFFCCELEVNLSSLLSSSSRRSVSDFSFALTRLHSQFGWPYPVAGRHVVDQLEKRFGAMKTSQSAANLNGTTYSDPSRASIPPVNTRLSDTKEDNVFETNESITESSTLSVQEALLVPVKNKDVNYDNGSEQRSRPPSPESSSVTKTVGTPDTRSTGGEWQGVEALIGESPSRGPSTCQAQVAHMIQLFSESAALHWVFLLCLMSRDVTRLRQEISAQQMDKWGTESFDDLRRGCIHLMEWAVANCLGYVSVLQMFQSHVDMVAQQCGFSAVQITKKSVNGVAKSNGVYRSARTSTAAPTPSGTLRESFGAPSTRRRERSRSVDRGIDQTVSNQQDESNCSIM